MMTQPLIVVPVATDNMTAPRSMITASCKIHEKCQPTEPKDLGGGHHSLASGEGRIVSCCRAAYCKTNNKGHFFLVIMAHESSTNGPSWTAALPLKQMLSCNQCMVCCNRRCIVAIVHFLQQKHSRQRSKHQ